MPLSYNVLYNKYYIDEFYSLTVVNGAKFISSFLRFLEVFLVEGLVKSVTGITSALGRLGSKFQNGQIQTYGTAAFVGLAILVVIYAFTGGYLK